MKLRSPLSETKDIDGILQPIRWVLWYTQNWIDLWIFDNTHWYYGFRNLSGLKGNDISASTADLI